MESGEKLRDLIAEKGWKQREFADMIDHSLSQLNKVLRGERNVSSKMIEKLIVVFPDLDLNWFLRNDVTIRNMVTEEGTPYKKELNPKQILKNMEQEIKALQSIMTQK